MTSADCCSHRSAKSQLCHLRAGLGPPDTKPDAVRRNSCAAIDREATGPAGVVSASGFSFVIRAFFAIERYANVRTASVSQRGPLMRFDQSPVSTNNAAILREAGRMVRQHVDE